MHAHLAAPQAELEVHALDDGAKLGFGGHTRENIHAMNLLVLGRRTGMEIASKSTRHPETSVVQFHLLQHDFAIFDELCDALCILICWCELQLHHLRQLMLLEAAVLLRTVPHSRTRLQAAANEEADRGQCRGQMSETREVDVNTTMGSVGVDNRDHVVELLLIDTEERRQPLLDVLREASGVMRH